ncbi:BrnA antitoxin family protein [Bdellovibrio sp. HCB2-146]|uniref:BrnA antitoxin family protein n=1 Tax=Bdellovibrio sp. HCB2-146 TaxID=3394362 RepID=UPI0039BD8A33
MKKEYDFSEAKKNPYAKKLKVRTTIRLDDQVIEYFQGLADATEIPYQTLINLYLRDCVAKKRKPDLGWGK